MIDIVDKKTRSRMMSGIRSKNTKPEILTRKALHGLGYRYRLGTKIGCISPDIVLPSHKVSIFVHGCFWHQHTGCKLAYSDRDYSESWMIKFHQNRKRDIRTVDSLINAGWRVVVVWECATRNLIAFTILIDKLDQWIQLSQNQYFESDYTHQPKRNLEELTEVEDQG